MKKHKPVVLYVKGQLRNLNRLPVSDMTVEYVAGTLAKINRFVGHTPEPYSVAQHAVLVSVLASPRLQYEALHHDDTEAFVGDLASPIKDLCPEFRALEKKIRRRIAPVFGLKPVEPAQVKVWDEHARRLEQWHVQGRQDMPEPEWADWAEIQVLLVPMDWTTARDLYLWQHERLLSRRT